ncbi:MAG: alpha/beta fold hydrolase [Myxococcaceae bacterium]|jgi:polyhydroxyalkanoate synthase|nr:alpha/beta fold hydrolase [Myxococcaceae bacterium]
MNVKSLANLVSLAARPKPAVGSTPADVVWQENKWRLLRYRSRPGGPGYRTPLLLVPSLINRHYVLDLMPGKSFAEAMVQRGFDVFCIDWGTPSDEDRFVTFDDVVDRWLGRAIRVASKTVPHEKVHLLGYCMGGTLATIHGAVHPERIASMIALAAPIRFKDDSLLSRWTNAKGFDVDVLVDSLGNVPWQLLQSAFHLLRPTLSLSKAVSLLDRAWNDEFLDGFLALETWGNDNVSLPGEFYRRYIKALYQGDGLLEGGFTLSGRRVDLRRITFPTLAVSFEHDNIVPGPSAGVLVGAIGSAVKEHLHLPGGHVGAVVSKHAAKTLWPKLEAFYAAHDAPPLTAAPEPSTSTPRTSAAPHQPAAASPEPSRASPLREASTSQPLPASTLPTETAPSPPVSTRQVTATSPQPPPAAQQRAAPAGQPTAASPHPAEVASSPPPSTRNPTAPSSHAAASSRSGTRGPRPTALRSSPADVDDRPTPSERPKSQSTPTALRTPARAASPTAKTTPPGAKVVPLRDDAAAARASPTSRSAVEPRAAPSVAEVVSLREPSTAKPKSEGRPGGAKAREGRASKRDQARRSSPRRPGPRVAR